MSFPVTDGLADDGISKDTILQQSLYQKHQKIYPREVHDLFATLRVLVASGLLGLYYILPWLSWDGRQVVLFDLPGRKFYVFGTTLWPQDFLILAFLLILAAFSLFFFTALAGRLWCGYACPQTVWTGLFLWVERKIEGNPSQQRALDQAPWTLAKYVKKIGKHTLWLCIAGLTAFTFVAYFTPAHILVNELLTIQFGFWEGLWIAFFTLATYANAGWMREQVCKYMCPYARFQSAMFDSDTLIISYDGLRGEPRGARRAGSDHRRQGLGDCIDCKLCVAVCPTGIDIRDGLQYECIGCSACIDACNGVMDTIGYPRGLIRYTTDNAVAGKPSRILRPRIIMYMALLVLLSAITVYSLVQRVPLHLNVLHDRNQLYRDVGELIENVYTVRIINMDDVAHVYHLSADGIAGLELADAEPITVAAGAVHAQPVRLRVYEDNLQKRSTEIAFKLTAADVPGLSTVEAARFLGPAP